VYEYPGMLHCVYEPNQSNASVLLVEDDAGLRNVLAVCLRIAGFKVDTAKDEGSALERFAQSRPTVVVSDLVLPEGEGMQTVQRMHEAAPDMPIVVISGGGWFPASHLLGVARSLGASAALSKPFKPAALVEVLRGLAPPEPCCGPCRA
jgi:DNA-binding NtrC family response regulator